MYVEYTEVKSITKRANDVFEIENILFLKTFLNTNFKKFIK